MSRQSTRGIPLYQIGQKIGRWIVVSGPHRHPKWPSNRHPVWECRCDCGTLGRVVQGDLRNGRSTSCGCLRAEQVAAKNTSHGLSDTVAYRRWKGMLDRCYNPKNKSYRHYGGRGIRVYRSWRDSFPAFLAYIGPPPTERHEIDRYPNNDGNYEPGNVRWATHKENCQNTRRTKRRK